MAKSISENVSGMIKNKGTFDLESFKKSKYLTSSLKFKQQQWIPWSKAMQDITSIPGAPHGHITLLRGHSDTGKTTALLELAVNAQRMGILPVLIITEMKWSWEHAKQMGLQFDEVVGKDGQTSYEGFFIYIDRGSLQSIEDVAVFINDLMDEQKKGNLPHDMCFLWDSIGSVPCELSVRSNKNNNEWNAGAMSTQFGNNINQKIVLTRKETSPYTNSLVCINKIWVMKPETIMSQPKIKNKGGETMFFDATVVVTYGNTTNSGTSKIKATKSGKEVEFAKRTRVQIDKNHVTGIQTKGYITMTPHGFIPDDKKAIDEYKKVHSSEWASILGGTDFDIVVEEEMKEDVRDILDTLTDNEE
jgi:hypothetical protein